MRKKKKKNSSDKTSKLLFWNSDFLTLKEAYFKGPLRQFYISRSVCFVFDTNSACAKLHCGKWSEAFAASVLTLVSHLTSRTWQRTWKTFHAGSTFLSAAEGEHTRARSKPDHISLRTLEKKKPKIPSRLILTAYWMKRPRGPSPRSPSTNKKWAWAPAGLETLSRGGSGRLLLPLILSSHRPEL